MENIMNDQPVMTYNIRSRFEFYTSISDFCEYELHNMLYQTICGGAAQELYYNMSEWEMDIDYD